jgi:hypothetical protein
MNRLNLSTLLILCFLLLSCKPKTEKKQPPIYNSTQNYKFDDDEIQKRNTKDSLKKVESHKDQSKKPSIKK